MALKFSLDSLEGLDESIAALYSKADSGKFFLQVEGAVAKAKVDEFRTSNIALTKERDDLKVTAQSWETKFKELKDKVPKKEDYVLKVDVDELLNKRVDKMKTEHETELGTRDKKLDTQNSQLSSLLIDSEVRRAATHHKVQESAVEDVILRAKTSFKVEAGAAVLYKDGNVVYGKDGSTPQSVGEWVESLQESAPHLFEGSTGTGSTRSYQHGKQPNNMSSIGKIAEGLKR